MADKVREVGIEDVAAVGSRVSWGAIFAGAVMALATFFVLSLLGGAIGLSLSDAASSSSIGMGAGIWAILSLLISMFVGGFVATQCTVGETKGEALIHGVVMWGVATAMILWMAMSGIGFGIHTTMQAANAAGNTSNQTWQKMAMAAGVSQDQIDQWTNHAANRADDADVQEAAQDTATQAAWWTLAGVVLSIAASVGGAVLGAGPDFQLAGVGVVSRTTSRSVAGGA
jgi:hypothetical protein